MELKMARVEIHRSEPLIKEARYLTICGKTSDRFSGTLESSEGEDVYRYDGYVPSNLGIGGGDYIEMKIDLHSGMIVKWKPITNIVIEED